MRKHVLTDISFFEADLTGVNNDELKNICLQNTSNLMSDDLTDTRNEDIILPMNNVLGNLFVKIENEFNSIFPYENRDLYVIKDYWAQVHKKYESTNTHNHVDPSNLSTSSSYSGVYYVSLPKDSGKLVLEYNINQYETKRWWPEIAEQKVIIFPSTLNHFVTKNLSDENRIVISFNLYNDRH